MLKTRSEYFNFWVWQFKNKFKDPVFRSIWFLRLKKKIMKKGKSFKKIWLLFKLLKKNQIKPFKYIINTIVNLNRILGIENMYKKQRPQILSFRQVIGTGLKELAKGFEKDKTRSVFNRFFTVVFLISSGFYKNLVNQKPLYFFSWKLKKNIFKRKKKKTFKKFFFKVEKRHVN